MIRLLQCLLTFFFFMLIMSGFPSIAAEMTPSPDSASGEAGQAKALLERAARRYHAEGGKALATFSRAGEFVDGDLYVYVIGKGGVLLASGGPSVALVGRDVRQLKDIDGKLFVQEIMNVAAERGEGVVEYRWLNREHGRMERKIAYFRAVDDAIVAVGYYIPRASPQEAKAMLVQAIKVMEKDPKSAITRFNEMNGGFIADDLYVFVVGIDDKVMHAHGATPRLVGRNVEELRDDSGKPIVRLLLESARSRGNGELQYKWLNPVTRKHEKKLTYWSRVGRYVVAVGSYSP